MASLFKSEKSAQYSARKNACAALLELAKKNPVVVMTGLLAKPELTHKLQDFNEIVEILLAKGQKDNLVKLAQAKQVHPDAKSFITRHISDTDWAFICQPSA